MHIVRKNAITGLDAFRGILAIWVLWFHSRANDNGIFPQDNFTSRIVQKGFLGVVGFFSLSGFIIMHVYQKDFSERAGFFKKYCKFIYFRVARILPLHCVMSILWVKDLWWPEGSSMNKCSLKDYFSEITMTSPFYYPNEYLGICNLVCWSILREFYAYFLFPILVPIFTFINRRNWICLNIGFIVGFHYLIEMGKNVCNQNAWNVAAHFINDTLFKFFMGMALYKIYEKYKKNHFLNDIVVILMISYVLYAINEKFEVKNYEPVLLLFPLPLAGMNWWVKSLFESKLGKFLGDISFSLYLSHFFWIKYFAEKVILFSSSL